MAQLFELTFLQGLTFQQSDPAVGMLVSGSNYSTTNATSTQAPTHSPHQPTNPPTCHCACCQSLVHDGHQLLLTTHLSLNSTCEGRVRDRNTNRTSNLQ